VKRVVVAILLLALLVSVCVPIMTTNALTIPDVSVNPLNPTVGKLGKLFNVSVTIASVTNLYGYEFKLSFNTTLLKATKVFNGTIFPAYPNSYTLKSQINNTDGTIWFAEALLAPQLPKNGTGILAKITFNATYSTIYPNTLSCPLHIYGVKLSDQNGNPMPSNPIDGVYTFAPLRGDINRDGKVDIIDVVIVGIAFGSTPETPNWNPNADFNEDGIVDIFDVVLVTVNYGKSG
jgi:hypothetical protein